MECKIEQNKQSCPCTYEPCERKGICCECLRAHLSSKSLPACIKNLDWVQVTS